MLPRRARAAALGVVFIAVFLIGLLWQRPDVPAGHGPGGVLLDAPEPTPGQPAAPPGWPAYNTTYEWPLVQLNATQLWVHGEGNGVRVAVVGTGIDPRNPDLAGAVIAAQGGGGHGGPGDRATEIAGLIAGRGSPIDPAVVAGLAPQAQLIDIRVARVTAAAISAGIDQAVGAGARVIDVSLGVSLANGDKGIGQLQHAVTLATKQGDLVVAPVGSAGQVDTYPARSNGAIAVAATNGRSLAPAGALAGYGGNAVYAPGDDLYSTRGPVGYAGEVSGNDLATAYVSAAAALLWSAMPDPSEKAIEPLLVHDVSGTRSASGHGTLDPLEIMEQQHLPFASSSAAGKGPQSPGAQSQATGQQAGAPAPGASSSVTTQWSSGQASAAGSGGLSLLDGVVIGAGGVIVVMLVAWLALRHFTRKPPGPPGPRSGGGLIERFPIDWDLEPQ